jgi:serine/threonine-protein kinase RsbW
MDAGNHPNPWGEVMSKSPAAPDRQVLRRPARWHQASARTLDEAARVVETITAQVRAADFSKQDVFAVRLALDEALVNAIKHGHGGDPAKAVRVRWRLRPGGVQVRVLDRGPGFDPGDVADPLTGAGLERDCGRGLLLMRAAMTRVRYSRRGNAVSLYKARSRT